MAKNRFSVEAIFKGIDKITAPVTRMQNSVGKFTRSMSGGLSKVTKVTDKISGGIKRAAAASTVALALTAAAMANVVTTGMEFEQSIVNASAKFPEGIKKGSAAFTELSDAARQVGRSTEFTASQSAEALNYLAMAGFTAKSAIIALPKVVNLATAAQTDLALATDIATDTLGAFNLLTKDSIQLGKNLQRVNDVMAKTSVTSNTNLVQMFEAIKEIGPVATAAGAKIDTVAALIGTLANSGIKASDAGTTLKNVFVRLTAVAPEAARMLNKLGVKTKDARGNMRDVVDIIGDLNKGLKGLGSADKLAAIETIFGKIPLAGVNVLLNAGTDALKAYRTQLEGAAGASDAMAATMRDTVRGSLLGLQSAVESVKISIFDMNNGPLKEVIDRTTAWVRVNEDLIASKVGGFLKGLIDNLDRIVFWMKAVGTALAVFFVFTTMLKTLALILTTINLIMAANPIVLLVLGLLAAIAVITALVLLIYKFRAAILGFIKDHAVFIAAIGSMLGPIGMLIGAAALIIKYWEPLKAFFVGLWDGIVAAFKVAMDYIKPALDWYMKLNDTAVRIMAPLDKAFGLGKDKEEPAGAQGGAQVVSPQERVARSIEEHKTTSTSEVTIKDETGRATISRGKLGPGLKLTSSGAF